MSENNYGAMMMKTVVGVSDDINSILLPGIYPIPASNPSSPDPAGGTLIIHAGSPIRRTFISDSTLSVVSTRNNGIWSAWNYPLSRLHPFADIKTDGASAIAEALANLGLKSAAQRDVGTAANQIPDMNSFTSNISASSGYQQLPGGLTIQFGTSPIPTNGSATVTLPRAAQNRINLTMATLSGSQGSTPDSVWISATTTTTITLNHYGDNGSITAIWFVLSN